VEDDEAGVRVAELQHLGREGGREGGREEGVSEKKGSVF